MAHGELLDAANAAVNKLFGDTSVPKRKTRESLEEIQSNIEGMIDALTEEIKNEEE